VPVRIFLGPPGDATQARQSADADEDGRFEFPAPATGEVRLWLVPHSGGRDADDSPADAPPFVTPPFLI
jgi:hypothetical protein